MPKQIVEASGLHADQFGADVPVAVCVCDAHFSFKSVRDCWKEVPKQIVEASGLHADQFGADVPIAFCVCGEQMPFMSERDC